MNTRLETSANHDGWTRVSSFKPQIMAFLVTGVVASLLLILFGEKREYLPLLVAGIAVGVGLIALNCKVIHKRGTEYRISTLFYSEVVAVDDVCMSVTKHGAFWSRLRIHLRRPARFGWMFSFVPVEEALITPESQPKPTGA